MARNKSDQPDPRRTPPAADAEAEVPGDGVPSKVVQRAVKPGTGPLGHRRNGGWREIEARREKAALKASLADVWDEDFDLDEEILAELDHTAEFFTTQEDAEEEVFEEDDEADEYFDDEEV